jgi:hypothetical protein
MSLAMLAIIAPGVYRMNRGVTLRNIGIWIAIFTLLGLFYKNFGPESDKPMFKKPEAMALRQSRLQEKDAQKKLPVYGVSKFDKALPDKNDQAQIGKITTPNELGN